MQITMPNPNFNFYRYQKIKVLLSNQSTTPSQPMIINRLSGDWLIIDIRFMFKDGKITQYMTLIRRELSLSDDELSQEPNTSKTPPKNTQTTNPNPVTTNPNPGQIIGVQPTSGT